MNIDEPEVDTLEVRHERLVQLLDLLVQRGFSQQQVAERAKVPVQYLSDIKNGRRPLGELVARRIGEEFDVNFQWLLGNSNARENPRPLTSKVTGGTAWLPLHQHPVEGDPWSHPAWGGTDVQIAGRAVAKLALANKPYVLQFGHDDQEGRLQRGDLVLISQTVSETAAISVVKVRKKLFLARRLKQGTWKRLATEDELPAHSQVVGHCLGVVWSSLELVKR